MEEVCQDVLREEKIRGNVRCWITMQPCFRVHHVLGEEADLCVLGERCWPHTLSPSTVCVASWPVRHVFAFLLLIIMLVRRMSGSKGGV